MHIRKKFREWFSIQVAKRPGRVILVAILLLNLFFIAVSAGLISVLAPPSLKERGFWACVFYTVTMVLDAGCISFVVEDVGAASVGVILVCILIVVTGMIIFTGAVIGYVTNYISGFITDANAGENKLVLSGHTIILGWNSRGSEIVNDMLFSDERETIVVLVPDGREETEKEIEERLLLSSEAEWLEQQNEEHISLFHRIFRPTQAALRNRLTVIVREGSSYSTKQLMDIGIKDAKAVIILGHDAQNAVCRYDAIHRSEMPVSGNSGVVKTLIQVASMTGAEDSADNQRIIVEITDNRTGNLINKIIEHKENLGKCNIVPLRVNQLLGQLLSQFTIMPELNAVYSDLFSNKGAAFYSRHLTGEVHSHDYTPAYLKDHFQAVPLTYMDGKEGSEYYYVSDSEKGVDTFHRDVEIPPVALSLNPDFWMKRKNIVILGHDSNVESIMDGYMSYRSEWNFVTEKQMQEAGSAEILNILVIDTEESLKQHGYYEKYPFVDTLTMDLFDKDDICAAINRFVDTSTEDTSILILSDDKVVTEDLDSSALIYLIYVYDVIADRIRNDPDFDRGRIDVIVEIQDPKNYDIVSNYSINNIVISNRYISKMIGQISEKEAIYHFYEDILIYDTFNEGHFSSNELYVKRVSEFFTDIPGKCTAAQLIRSVYEAGPYENKSVVVGYVKKEDEEMVLFSGDQRSYELELHPEDKLILFANH